MLRLSFWISFLTVMVIVFSTSVEAVSTDGTSENFGSWDAAVDARYGGDTTAGGTAVSGNHDPSQENTITYRRTRRRLKVNRSRRAVSTKSQQNAVHRGGERNMSREPEKKEDASQPQESGEISAEEAHESKNDVVGDGSLGTVSDPLRPKRKLKVYKKTSDENKKVKNDVEDVSVESPQEEEIFLGRKKRTRKDVLNVGRERKKLDVRTKRGFLGIRTEKKKSHLGADGTRGGVRADSTADPVEDETENEIQKYRRANTGKASRRKVKVNMEWVDGDVTLDDVIPKKDREAKKVNVRTRRSILGVGEDSRKLDVGPSRKKANMYSSPRKLKRKVDLDRLREGRAVDETTEVDAEVKADEEVVAVEVRKKEEVAAEKDDPSVRQSVSRFGGLLRSGSVKKKKGNPYTRKINTTTRQRSSVGSRSNVRLFNTANQRNSLQYLQQNIFKDAIGDLDGANGGDVVRFEVAEVSESVSESEAIVKPDVILFGPGGPLVIIAKMEQKAVVRAPMPEPEVVVETEDEVIVDDVAVEAVDVEVDEAVEQKESGFFSQMVQKIFGWFE